MSSDIDQAAGLAAEFHRLAAGFSGEVGYLVKNLTSGETIESAADRTFPSASAIKLPILTAMHAFVEVGGVAWDDLAEHTKASGAEGSGVLRYLSAAVTLSYRDAAWLMICVSDNVATNLIIDAIGLERTNRLIQQLISPDLQVLRHAGTGTDSVGDSMGFATPRALARQLELLDGGELPGSAQTLSVARQQCDRDGVARYVREPAPGRPGVIVASKGGSVAGIRCEAGLLEAGAVKIVVSVMTSRPVESGLGVVDEAMRLIGQIARASLQAWADPAVAP